VLVFLFVIFLFPQIDVINLSTIQLPNILLPYGVLIFAFFGLPAIPEMSEELKNNKKALKRCILTGTLTVAFIYLIFAAIVVGISGSNTTEVAVVGLANELGTGLLLFGNLFGLIALLTSAIPISLATKELFNYDLGVSKRASFAFATILPFAFFLIIKNFSSFSILLNIVGSVFCSIQMILVILMLKSAKINGDRKPEYSIYLSKPIIFIVIFLIVIGMIQAIV
jgi:amino acid permease